MSIKLYFSEYYTREDKKDVIRMHDSSWWLAKQMGKAIKRYDVAGVEFLLKAGVPANTPMEIGPFGLTLMGYALTKNLAIAKLLRKYRALFMFAPEDAADLPEFGSSESARLIFEYHADQIVPGAADWLVDDGQPRAGSEPLPTYEDDSDATPSFKYRKGRVEGSRHNPPRNVLISWPPNVSLEGCTESMKKDIEKFWSDVGKVRLAEARHRKKRNWYVFRLMMRMRGIAMFWMRVTQENGCKPEGVLRKRDRETWEEDDLFS